MDRFAIGALWLGLSLACAWPCRVGRQVSKLSLPLMSRMPAQPQEINDKGVEQLDKHCSAGPSG